MVRTACLLGLLAAGCGATLEDPTQRGTGDGGHPGGGGQGSGSGSGQGGDLSATEFLSDYAMLDCDEAFACKASFPSSQADFEQSWGQSAQQCQGQYLLSLRPAQTEIGISQGTIKYDAGDAADCLASITFGNCSDYWSNGPDYGTACDRVFDGKLATGQPCDVDFACTSQHCDLDIGQCS